jgi:hypothetical protein
MSETAVECFSVEACSEASLDPQGCNHLLRRRKRGRGRGRDPAGGVMLLDRGEALMGKV